MTTTYVNKLLANNAIVAICSGEGEYGTFERFTGKKTVLAINRRLIRETCGGDRWAVAIIEDGEHAVEFNGREITGQCEFPELDD